MVTGWWKFMLKFALARVKNFRNAHYGIGFYLCMTCSSVVSSGIF